MKTKLSTPTTRWQKRSLTQMLLHKFLDEYGYQNGAIIAKAIVEDILTLIDEQYSDKLPPHYVIWPAVPVENGSTGKSPEVHDLVSVRLHLVTDAEVALLHDQHLLGIHRAIAHLQPTALRSLVFRCLQARRRSHLSRSQPPQWLERKSHHSAPA